MESKREVELQLQLQAERGNRIQAQLVALQSQARLCQIESQECKAEHERLKALLATIIESEQESKSVEGGSNGQGERAVESA